MMTNLKEKDILRENLNKINRRLRLQALVTPTWVTPDHMDYYHFQKKVKNKRFLLP